MLNKPSARFEAVGKNERRAGRDNHSSDERFRATFDQAAVGITHSDLDGRFLLVNRTFCRMIGYTEAEVLVMAPQQLTHPDDRIGGPGKAQLLRGEVESVEQ